MDKHEGLKLEHHCHISNNIEGDTFVGIKSEEDKIAVYFPLGYRLPKGDRSLRQDIIRLLSVLSRFTVVKDSQLATEQIHQEEEVKFPLQAYMYIINDFMQNDYYVENEVFYRENKIGKINWAKTIKRQKPYSQENSIVYLNYIVKDSSVNNESIISLIHEYCVYESFVKLGWLYTTTMPRSPRILVFDKSYFSSVIYDKLAQTFNDNHKNLFINMLSIINYLGQKNTPKQFYFGTNRFEYVWEKLIDFTYGIKEKSRYFPKTHWHFKEGKYRNNAALEPDTIMIVGSKLFILDAKYYKYGVTMNPNHLPESTSINKQITYGEYIATQQEFKDELGQDLKVYNAFLMPFNNTCPQSSSQNVLNIGEATADWKENNNHYEKVQGILIDVRTLIFNTVSQNPNEIMKLNIEIEKAFS